MITGNSYIEDIVREYPQLIRPLAEYNLMCVACGEPVWGNLAELAKTRGVNNLAEIIREMNQLIAVTN